VAEAVMEPIILTGRLHDFDEDDGGTVLTGELDIETRRGPSEALRVLLRTVDEAEEPVHATLTALRNTRLRITIDVLV
jgi:hypothetical protein